MHGGRPGKPDLTRVDQALDRHLGSKSARDADGNGFGDVPEATLGRGPRMER